MVGAANADGRSWRGDAVGSGPFAPYQASDAAKAATQQRHEAFLFALRAAARTVAVEAQSRALSHGELRTIHHQQLRLRLATGDDSVAFVDLVALPELLLLPCRRFDMDHTGNKLYPPHRLGKRQRRGQK